MRFMRDSFSPCPSCHIVARPESTGGRTRIFIIDDHRDPEGGSAAAEAVGEGAPAGVLSDAPGIQEILTRVTELLYSTARSSVAAGFDGTIRVGQAALEPAIGIVHREGRSRRLTATELRLFLALFRRQGATASRADLLREVWGGTDAVAPRAVDTNIARLRRKLEDDPASPRHILTAPAQGYRLLV